MMLAQSFNAAPMNDDAAPSNALTPMAMCSHTVTLHRYLPGWTLADFVDAAKPTPREFEYLVCFDQPFANVPLVHAGIAGFDLDNRDTGRVLVSVDDITSTSFKLKVRTWMHSRLYRVDISWLAIGNGA